MKKIMFVLAAVAMAMGVQAAAITWKMGTAIKAPNADGSVGTANAANGTLSMYVWLVDQATYNAATADSIVSGYTSKIGSADASAPEATRVGGWSATSWTCGAFRYRWACSWLLSC